MYLLSVSTPSKSVAVRPSGSALISISEVTSHNEAWPFLRG